MHKGAVLAAAERDAPSRPVSILIAEDSESNQALYSLYFKDTGHIIAFAENGREAVDAYRNGEYDLVLMDLYMPVLDGLDATREIRAFEQANDLPPTPIVAVSASPVTDGMDGSACAGCTEFLSKPVRKKTLLDCVHRLTRGAGA